MSFRYAGKRLKDSYEREEYKTHLEWFEEKIVFTSSDQSPVTGNFSVKYSPHYIKLFQLMDRASVKRIFAKWASQSGKSLWVVGVAAKRLDTEPATIIYMQPIKDDVPKVLTLKINPVLKAIPSLWKKFEDYKDVEKFRTKDAIKRVPGGNLVVSGSSVKERKSLSTPLLLGDELGEFEKGSFKEAEERTKAFSKFFPKIVGVSTIVSPDDEICSNFNKCEIKLEWRFKCRECEKNFYPLREHIKWTTKEDLTKEKDVEVDEIDMTLYKSAARTSCHIECPHCYSKINNDLKDEMILNGELDWYLQDSDCNAEPWELDEEDDAISYGVDMNSTGSYFANLSDIVEGLIDAEDDEVELDKVYRGWLNRFYENNKNKSTSSDIRLLGNGIPEWQIPDKTIPHALYMGVDSQKTHFWVVIKAFQYGKIGNTVFAGRVETLNQVEEIFRREFRDDRGNQYYVSKLGIDRQGYVEKQEIEDEDGEKYEVETQNNIDMVDEWCMDMVERYGEDVIYPTIGKGKLSNDMSYQEFTLKKDIGKTRHPIPVKGFKMSNINLKTKLETTVKRSVEKEKAEDDTEKGYHYKNRLTYVNQTIIDVLNAKNESVSTDYDRQMTSESLRYPMVNGKPKKEKVYERIGRDNHIWDCEVICEMFADMDRIASLVPPAEELESSEDLIGMMTSIG